MFGVTLMLSIRAVSAKGAALVMLCAPSAYAADFNQYGAAPAEFVAPQMDRPDLVIELGLSGGAAPTYMGSSELGATVSPIIRIERLNIPGVIDIDKSRSQGGFKFAPSIGVQAARTSADHPELTGLDDIDMTFELGGKVGYEFIFNDALSAEVYGEARYAFGGAEGLVGDVGVDVTARLTPQLEVVGGVSAALSDEGYTDTYYGVSGAESAASGGAFDAFDPTGGVTSVGIKVAAKYEFIPDTFFNANAEYRKLVGSAADSPIVQAGRDDQFIFGVGISRRFSLSY
jgi:outer membrane protein